MLLNIWRLFVKFLKKTNMQKRRDIFVDSLVVLGYIVKRKMESMSCIDFDKEELTLLGVISYSWALFDFLSIHYNVTGNISE